MRKNDSVKLSGSKPFNIITGTDPHARRYIYAHYSVQDLAMKSVSSTEKKFYILLYFPWIVSFLPSFLCQIEARTEENSTSAQTDIHVDPRAIIE